MANNNKNNNDNNDGFKIAAVAGGAIGLGLLLAKFLSKDEDEETGNHRQGEAQAEGSKDDRQQEYIKCKSRGDAYARARLAGNGAEPIWNPAHKVGDYDHYHPGGSRNQTNKHFIYGEKKTY